MNGWYTDPQGSPRYVTMDAAAFAEIVAGLLGAGLPFNAGQEFGIYSIQLLMPPPMTDSHEALAMAGKDRVAEYYRQNSPVDLPDGPTDKRRIGYVGAIDPEWGPDPGPEPQELDFENAIAQATVILARGLADIWRSVATSAADLADQLTQMADAADLENQLTAIQTEPDSDTPEGYKLWAGRCKEALAHDRRPRSTQWVCGDITCDGCYEPNPPALVENPDEITQIQLFLWRAP